MQNNCTVRRMTLSDLDAVMAIEEATFPTPWSKDSFRQELERNVAARYLVAEKDGAVIGYAGAWVILDESHITNIAIAESQRGNGYGRRLSAALAARARQTGLHPLLCCRPQLEELYRTAGFVPIGKQTLVRPL